jgi:hypothetical protein
MQRTPCNHRGRNWAPGTCQRRSRLGEPDAGTATSSALQAAKSNTAGATTVGDARCFINNVVSFVHARGVRYSEAANQLFLDERCGNCLAGSITLGAVCYAEEQPVCA